MGLSKKGRLETLCCEMIEADLAVLVANARTLDEAWSVLNSFHGSVKMMLKKCLEQLCILKPKSTSWADACAYITKVNDRCKAMKLLAEEINYTSKFFASNVVDKLFGAVNKNKGINIETHFNNLFLAHLKQGDGLHNNEARFDTMIEASKIKTGGRSAKETWRREQPVAIAAEAVPTLATAEDKTSQGGCTGGELKQQGQEGQGGSQMPLPPAEA